MSENFLIGIKNRILQIFARLLPGATSIRVALNRMRGVKIGKGVWIGYDSIIETSNPQLVSIGNNAIIGIRATIIAHYKEKERVVIEDDVFIGPGAIILPGVTIGTGAVITAGSVVTHSVTTMTMAQGNPAIPVAKCGIPLSMKVSLKEFTNNLKPL